MDEVFDSRESAGRQLAEVLNDKLSEADRAGAQVLALPRGGLPVAAEVARALGRPLDLLIVRKVGAPANPELAMGAVASGGVEVANESVCRTWDIGVEQFRRIAEQEHEEVVRRESLYRRGLAPLEIADRPVILIDDGIATGSTVKAGVAALRKLGASRVIVAVPVAAAETLRELQALADRVVSVQAPDFFRAVGYFYRDFHQVSDEEVRQIMSEAANQDG